MKWKFRVIALTLLFGGVMSAQPPTVTVNDYLPQVRVFAQGSPEFSQIAAAQGVSTTLPTLGAGAALVAAIRNDSGQAVELRILVQLAKGGKTMTHDLELGRPLAAGEATLVGPREVRGVLAGLIHSGRPGLINSGSPTVQPLDAYQGSTVTISIDSATLADGRFIGADTQNMFDRLVAEDAARKSFFSDLAGSVSAGQSQAQIEQALSTRKAAARLAKSGSTGIADFSPAAQTEFSLSTMALVQLQHSGLANLSSWAERENAKLQSKPTLHR